MGAGTGAGVAASTVIVLRMLVVRRLLSVTVRRTSFVPAAPNVKRSVGPVPSFHCVPPAPSGPSSSHAYEHPVHVEAVNVTCLPATGVTA